MKLTDKVYEDLKHRIFEAQFSPNDLISERQIAEEYNVSKLTAGEVLHRLCADGHLTSYPRSGYMVTAISPTEMNEIRELRMLIESYALEIVCREASGARIRDLRDFIIPADDVDSANKVNFNFHMEVVKLTGNKFIISFMETLLGTLCRTEMNIQVADREHWQDCHVKIVDSLEKRDADAAKAALTEDISLLKF
jgi:DNA-binding GntR family transcriptional regulator